MSWMLPVKRKKNHKMMQLVKFTLPKEGAIYKLIQLMPNIFLYFLDQLMVHTDVEVVNGRFVEIILVKKVLFIKTQENVNFSQTVI